MLLLRQLKLEQLGVVVVGQNLRELQIDESLIAASEGLQGRFVLAQFPWVFGGCGRVGGGFLGSKEVIACDACADGGSANDPWCR